MYNKEWWKKYYAKNREKILEYSKARYYKKWEYEKSRREKWILSNESKHREYDKKSAKKRRLLKKMDKAAEERIWIIKNPNGKKAHSIVWRAIRAGKIVKGKCVFDDQSCSNVVHAHHENYDKPLDVVWLCASHHKKVDLGLLKINIIKKYNGNK